MARALVVNSGNANAFTGKTGRAATAFTAKLAAQASGCKPGEVFLASTGVIGEPLDGMKIARVLADLAAEARGDRLMDAAKAKDAIDSRVKDCTDISTPLSTEWVGKTRAEFESQFVDPNKLRHAAIAKFLATTPDPAKSQ